jgi:alpha-ketoglutarate-dependent taurine dioxygenase
MGGIDGRAGQGRHVIRRAALVIAAATLVAGAARAAENAKQVDAELLEFLGSIDAEEEGWQEYLEQKPVKPVEKKPPQKPAPAPRKPDPKQAKEK